MSLKTSANLSGSNSMTNVCMQTCQQLHDIPAEDDTRGARSIGDAAACVEGRDGRDYPVWKNPSDREFANLISGSRHENGSLRAMLTEHDLYLWQSVHVLHGDFVRQTGVDGVRIRLAPDLVAVNEETVGVPSEFPWIFENDCDLIEIEHRCEIVERWLKTNSRLAVIYRRCFTVIWYM